MIKPLKPGLYFIALQGAFLLAGLFAAVRTSADDKTRPAAVGAEKQLIHSLKGDDIFRSYCASCHGVSGKGDGPVAPALNASLKDLTEIARRNGGIFPVAHVRNIIAGDEVILGHGSREMPIWGPVFHRVEEDRDYGEVRLQNITAYLKSIQK